MLFAGQRPSMDAIYQARLSAEAARLSADIAKRGSVESRPSCDVIEEESAPESEAAPKAGPAPIRMRLRGGPPMVPPTAPPAAKPEAAAPAGAAEAAGAAAEEQAVGLTRNRSQSTGNLIALDPDWRAPPHRKPFRALSIAPQSVLAGLLSPQTQSQLGSAPGH